MIQGNDKCDKMLDEVGCDCVVVMCCDDGVCGDGAVRGHDVIL